MFHPQQRHTFLVLKRSLQSYSRPGDWDFPGGNVLYGELHEESLKREITEETKLQIEEIKPVQVITNYVKENSMYFLLITYKATALSSTVILSHEHTEYRWMTRAEFLKLKPAKFLKDTVKVAFE